MFLHLPESFFCRSIGITGGSCEEDGSTHITGTENRDQNQRVDVRSKRRYLFSYTRVLNFFVLHASRLRHSNTVLAGNEREAQQCLPFSILGTLVRGIVWGVLEYYVHRNAVKEQAGLKDAHERP